MPYSSFCFFFALANLSGLAGLACPAKYRLLWIPSLITTSVLAFQRLSDIPISVDAASTLGLFIIIWNAHVISLVTVHHSDRVQFLMRQSRGEHEDTKKSFVLLPETQKEWHWKGAYKMLYNSRWIGSSIEVPGTRTAKVKPVEPAQRKKGSYPAISWHQYLEKYLISPRPTFMIIQIRRLLVIAAMTKFLSVILTNPQHQAFQPLQIFDINATHDSYFRRIGEVTARETTIRLITVFFFIWNAYANLTSLHAALSIIFVALLRFDDPDEWPPLFGSLGKAVSIRRFWTGFWHSLAYRPYEAIAEVLTNTLLGLKKHGALHRPMKNLVIFMCSGISHALVAQQLLPCGAREEIWWFSVNFAAVVFEDIFGLIVKKAGLRPSGAGGKLVWRIGGYLWTLGFMFWSLPKVQYPQLRCTVGGEV
ncbi:uncharacterized protein Z518_08253 [Rhinocladiella mackenziei CBS 650.93]|uniref:Rhinocladiella mackenziei CBS 650.93 unplaced genomic scaffold supercont1.6, whole genome shotgun sequence n=1 Tax=Rhinocladiella mackenziei CBS 650.93 TaxID=1442369 RepID=A0A0D2FK03_9EURO|nr:uncharacterized protein Z518_08253 [Rhinocladiella mackenziei CBS 650.93]KIX02312.1 hypothetical protein Z518_08253 [Rhinocladiella mackenziei CBS 650.93]